MTQEILHIKEFSEWNSGPDIRKCTECGVRLWLETDGIWTDDRSEWENPPVEYISCREIKK